MFDVKWFQWATPRNRIECMVRFLNDSKHTGWTLLIRSPVVQEQFWQLMGGYGVVRRIGKQQAYYENDTEADVWQT